MHNFLLYPTKLVLFIVSVIYSRSDPPHTSSTDQPLVCLFITFHRNLQTHPSRQIKHPLWLSTSFLPHFLPGHPVTPLGPFPLITSPVFPSSSTLEPEIPLSLRFRLLWFVELLYCSSLSVKLGLLSLRLPPIRFEWRWSFWDFQRWTTRRPYKKLHLKASRAWSTWFASYLTSRTKWTAPTSLTTPYPSLGKSFLFWTGPATPGSGADRFAPLLLPPPPPRLRLSSSPKRRP